MSGQKLLIYGGTFDPPHIGHLNNLRAAMKAVRPDRVLVMPAGTPPHKLASETPAEWRYEMCGCFCQLGPQVAISRWEIDHEGPSYTVNTLEALHEEYPAAALYLSLGSDMLESFRRWYRWERILQLATLVVQSRADGDDASLRAAAEALAPAGGRVVFAKAPAVPCASHEIRAGTLPAETLRAVLPPPVPDLVRRHDLYGLGKVL